MDLLKTNTNKQGILIKRNPCKRTHIQALLERCMVAMYIITNNLVQALVLTNYFSSNNRDLSELLEHESDPINKGKGPNNLGQMASRLNIFLVSTAMINHLHSANGKFVAC